MSKNNTNINGIKIKAWGFETADLVLWEVLKENSRSNRLNPTEAECILWQLLRNSNTGYKIRRQHAIDGYIADFVCLGKGLVIEVDGGYHQFTKEQDEIRTNVLNELGFHVIRFTNDEVLISPKCISESKGNIGQTTRQKNLILYPGEACSLQIKSPLLWRGLGEASSSP